MIKKQIFFVTLLITSIYGCSEMRDPTTTELAAATGGAVGAGLGAIIGSQTGDALGGVAIGTLAGAGTGAAVGNMLEQKEQAIAKQDAAIDKQEAMIQAQRNQINELRGVSGDQVSFDTGTPINSGGFGSTLGSSGSLGAAAPDYRAQINRPQMDGKVLVDPKTLKIPSSVAGFNNNANGLGSSFGSANTYQQDIPTNNFGGTNFNNPPLNNPMADSGLNSLSGGSVQQPSQAGVGQGYAAYGMNEPVVAKFPEATDTTLDPLPSAPTNVDLPTSINNDNLNSAQVVAPPSQQVLDQPALGQPAPSQLAAVAQEPQPEVAKNVPVSGVNKSQIAFESAGAATFAEPNTPPALPEANTAPANTEIESDSVMAAAALNTTNTNSECQKAEREAQKGAESPATADKLFYYRRALRLCPTDANWHVKLGEVYASLGRTEDARFEFQEALRLSPESETARAGLSTLGEGTY